MLYEELSNLYRRFRLMNYRSLFDRIREKDGSLSATEAYAVDVIYLLEDPTIKDFSAFLNISQPNASYKVNSLIGKGYIQRLPSPDDGREFRLRVTEKFFRYYDRKTRFIAEAADKLKKEFSAAELALFEKMLRSLSEASQ